MLYSMRHASIRPRRVVSTRANVRTCIRSETPIEELAGSVLHGLAASRERHHYAEMTGLGVRYLARELRIVVDGDRSW